MKHAVRRQEGDLTHERPACFPRLLCRLLEANSDFAEDEPALVFASSPFDVPDGAGPSSAGWNGLAEREDVRRAMDAAEAAIQIPHHVVGNERQLNLGVAGQTVPPDRPANRGPDRREIEPRFAGNGDAQTASRSPRVGCG